MKYTKYIEEKMRIVYIEDETAKRRDAAIERIWWHQIYK